MKALASIAAVLALTSASLTASAGDAAPDNGETSAQEGACVAMMVETGEETNADAMTVAYNPFCFERCLNGCADKDPTYGAVFLDCVQGCRRKCPGPIA